MNVFHFLLQGLAAVRELFAHHIVFTLGLLLFLGFFLGKLAERLKLPAITGYIVAGLLAGQSFLDLIHPVNNTSLHALSEVTLSFIALTIGGEFSFFKLKRYGRNVILLTLAQMLSTFAFIALGLWALGMPRYLAFLLGAIGAATAPAATVVIVEKLRARGLFVDYLYGIVALDDAGTIVLFSVVFAFSATAMTGRVVSLWHSIGHAGMEILLSVLLGAVSGLLIHIATLRDRNKNEMLLKCLGFVFLATSIAIGLQLSPLIVNMTTGMLLINASTKHVRLLQTIQPLTPPLYALFFAIAGTELSLDVFTDKRIFLIGIAYVLFRALGKYLGIYLPARACKLPRDISRYLGLSLLPQAGVAIGLVLFIQGSPMVISAGVEVQQEIVTMLNIVLLTVFINEIIGPPLSRVAILRSLKRS